MNILTKPVSEMTAYEVLLAAKVGRLVYDPNENSDYTNRTYNSLPSKEQILKQIADEEKLSKDKNNH